jgi:23S rRNA pseudouridine2605 synthase
MKLYEGKNNEIRRVMRKYSLRVNRLQRIRYGPYTLGQVPEHDNLREVSVVPQIKYILMQYYKDRARHASQLVEEAGNERTLQEANKAFKE